VVVDQTLDVNDSSSLHHRPEFWDVYSIWRLHFKILKKSKHVSYDTYFMLIMFFHNMSLKLYVHLLDLGMVAYVNKE
jgi:hypothetical protein